MENNSQKTVYSYSFDQHAVIWDNDFFDTVDGCLDDAWANNYNGETKVYVGTGIMWNASVDGNSVQDFLIESAYEDVGEVSESWKISDASQEQIDDLSARLTAVLNDWLKEINAVPNFCTIGDVKEYELGDRSSKKEGT